MRSSILWASSSSTASREDWHPDASAPRARAIGGKVLGTASSPDLIGQDVAVGPKGDLYAVHTSPSSVINWAEDKKKPATAGVPGTIAVVKGVVKVKFALPGSPAGRRSPA